MRGSIAPVTSALQIQLGNEEECNPVLAGQGIGMKLLQLGSRKIEILFRNNCRNQIRPRCQPQMVLHSS